MREVNKSFGLNPNIVNMLEAQQRITRSMSGFNTMKDIAKIMKDKTVFATPSMSAMNSIVNSMNFAIPSNIVNAIDSMNKRHEQLFGGFRAITESLKIQSPLIAQMNSLNFALTSISNHVTAIAIQQKNWELLDDFEGINDQAIEFSESLSQELDDEQKRQFQILLETVHLFFNKHKAIGISALLIIDIFLRFAGVHQYYDFLKDKPELATKTELNRINFKQDSVVHFIKLINNQLREANEHRLTNRVCLVKSKPKSKTLILATLPAKFEIIIIRVQHQWAYVSYFDPIDNLPQTGWVLKKYLVKP